MATVDGTNNSETLDALDGVTNGGDTIHGRGGNDTIFGNGGDDYIFGGDHRSDYGDSDQSGRQRPRHRLGPKPRSAAVSCRTRGVLSFLSKARQVSGGKTARFHHAARRPMRAPLRMR